MEKDTRYEGLEKAVEKILVECQKLTSELYTAKQECESYKTLVASYEQNQEKLLAQIEMLTALQKTAA